jgi:capsid protein
VTQTRGVTALAAVADLASNVDDTTFAQLIKTQFAAMVVGFLQRNGDYIADSQMGERKSSILPDGTTQMIEQLAAGMFLRGHKGEELKIQSGNVNTQETLDFLRYMLQIISLNLGMPLILGLLDASRSNMSSARVDLDSARMGFRKNQREFVRRFHRPLWRWWLLRKCFTEKSWAKQYERHGPALLRCHWETPRWPFIDPWKDVNSNALKLSTMQSSPRRVLADAGLKHGVIVDETVEDRFEQWDKAFVGWKKLIALHPEAKDVLTVRDMLNLDLYKGGQVIDSAEVDNDGGDAQTKRKTA